MTTRFHSLQVVLKDDIRDDDAEQIIAAIKQFRGVIAVTGHESNPTTFMAESRAKSVLADKLYEILRSPLNS